MKRIIIGTLLITMLTGCTVTHTPSDNLIEATVTNKHKDGYGGRSGYDYYITVEKNEQSIVLEVDSDIYKMIGKGNVVSGYYDDDGYFNNVSFPKLSDKPIDK